MSYKTIFIDAPVVKEKKGFGMNILVVNGDQFARTIEAAVLEKEREGNELMNVMPVHSSDIVMSTHIFGITSGAVLTFKKKEA